MKPLDFREVAHLINNSRVTEINLEPVKQEPGKWAIYSGVNKVPHFTYQFYVLYLFADSTKESVARASKSITNPKKTQIVYAPSIGLHIKDELRKAFREIAGVRNTTEYISDFVHDQLRAYHDIIIKENTPQYFIDPPYETPSGFRRKYPNPLKLFLSDNHPEINTKEGAVSILLAEPGQGKTYTAQYLASELCKNNMIPIYIHSQQWVSLSSTDLSSLWKTIINSFKYFETPIDWIEGCEEEFLNVALRAGLFRIIFDGFDEYILWNRGNVDPNDTLKNIVQLANTSGCKILITSRTSFWHSEVEDKYFSDVPIKPYIYMILPFDRNHANNYFNERLHNDRLRVKQALSVYDALSRIGTTSESANFAGRGFILNLIADLVEKSDGTSITFTGATPIIQWIMRSFCEREVKRQKLPITAEQQLEIFREFAEHASRDDFQPTTQLLRDMITGCVEGLKDEDLAMLLGESSTKQASSYSLQDHPLIRKNESGEWDFVHEQIRFALLAEQILVYIKKSSNALKNFFMNVKLKGSLQIDLATALIDQIISTVMPLEAKKEIQAMINALLTCCSPTTLTIEESQYERSLAGTIALLALNSLCPQGQERKERTKEFCSYFPGESLEGIHFSGTISSMDFSGITFKKCRFEKDTWANCKFDENTIFESCYFIGGKVINCENFGNAQWVSGYIDSEAKALISAYRIEAGKKQYTKDDLKHDIESMLRKIVPKEGVGFKTIYETHLTSGTIGHSKYKNIIVDTFSRFLLEKHEISSISGHAYNVKAAAKDSVKHYLTNGVYTGALADVYEDICKKLKLEK